MPSEPRPLKILFSMRHLGSFRMYESVIRLLASRGHHVHIVVDRGERMGWRKGLEQLLADCPTVAWSWAVSQRRNIWFEFSRAVRIWLDLLRYFDPKYDETPILRRRAEERVPRPLIVLNGLWPLTTRPGRAVLRKVLRLAERMLPRSRELDAFIAEESPDLMLVTPLVYLASPQLEMLRSAKAFGVRTALCVGSWDHLSSKALIRDRPMRVLVWNDTQRSEAVELHGIPPKDVVVTGAQCYDQWFDRRPSRSRDEFCSRIGVPADRPFLLYVCSALFWGSPIEAQFVVRWIESLRASGYDSLRDCGVLIRPHPARMDEWKDIDVRRFDRVAFYGSNPIDVDSRNDYFDSLFSCAAIVGLNTSAFLEAAVVGRPVHTVLLPEYFDNQEGTLHFHYLLNVGGGLLRAARSLEEHARQLDETLRGQHADNTRFVEKFIRPQGLEKPATEAFVEAVEQLAREPRPLPEVTPAWAPVARMPFLPLAFLARGTFGHSEDAEDRTSREIRRQKQREAHEQRLIDERRRHEELRQHEKAETLRQRESRRAAKIAAREQEQLERDRKVAQARREDASRKKQRVRAKEAARARKRRLALGRRILQRLGLA